MRGSESVVLNYPQTFEAALDEIWSELRRILILRHRNARPLEDMDIANELLRRGWADLPLAD